MHKFVARDNSDLVTASICRLGFIPRNSLVMLISPEGDGKYGGAIRLDLDALEIVEDALPRFTASMSNPAGVVIVFDGDAEITHKVTSLVSEIMPVVEAIYTDLETVWPLGSPDESVPLHLENHPLIAEMVAEGRPVLQSRDDKASVYRAGISPSLVSVEAIVSARKNAGSEPLEWLTHAGALTMRGTAGEALTDAEAAHVVAATLAGRARDLLWHQITAQNSEGSLRFWTSIAQRTPTDQAVAALTLAAFSAWQTGDGMAASSAAEAALAINPDYSMANLLYELLQSAVPPKAWAESGIVAENLLAGALTDLETSN